MAASVPADRLRSAALLASAATLVGVPTLGPLVAGTREGAEEYDTDITPPGYAFVIWAPIFVGAGATALQHAARAAAPVNRRTGWWLVGAYAVDTLWSVAAQSGRSRLTPRILPIAAALAGGAFAAAQRGPATRIDGVVADGAGLLWGWTSVASVVNVFATRPAPLLSTETRGGRVVARGAVALTAAGLAVAIGRSRRGYVAVAAAGAWALATIAAAPARTAATRVVAGVGATVLVGVTARKLASAKR